MPIVAAGLRQALRAGDPDAIENLVRETGFFSAEETTIARELADDGLTAGRNSHYRFLLAEQGVDLQGYACYGRIPCTSSSWDLYWIAVRPGMQRHHIGQTLLAATEADIGRAGGTRVYADTSSRTQYEPTRAFYQRAGYQQAAHFPDFYGPGDGKIVFLRVLSAT